MKTYVYLTRAKGVDRWSVFNFTSFIWALHLVVGKREGYQNQNGGSISSGGDLCPIVPHCSSFNEQKVCLIVPQSASL